jgi:hypothetical protein
MEVYNLLFLDTNLVFTQSLLDAVDGSIHLVVTFSEVHNALIEVITHAR